MLLSLASIDPWLLARDLALAFLVGALLYRLRGGFLATGSTQLARAMWAIPTGFFIGYSLGDNAVMAVGIVAAFVALLNPHGRWYEMANWRDALMMLVLGVVRFSVTLGWVWWVSPPAWWLPVVVGCAHPLAYLLGKHLPRPRGGVFLDAPTAWGELLWGGVQWTALLLACRAIAGTA